MRELWVVITRSTGYIGASAGHRRKAMTAPQGDGLDAQATLIIAGMSLDLARPVRPLQVFTAG
jgi:hypothetical protein